MASVAAPYGFRPVDSQFSDQGALGKVRRVLMTTNSANAIVKGNFITLASGQPSRITATPTAGTRSGAIAGLAWQFEYNFPDGRPYIGPYLPGGAVTAGYTNIIVSYLDDPSIVFQVQSDQSIALTDLGKNVAIGNFSADTAFTSKNTVTGAPATTATLAMRIVGFVPSPGSPAGVAGDAYTDILVQYNLGTHLSQIATGG